MIGATNQKISLESLLTYNTENDATKITTESLINDQYLCPKSSCKNIPKIVGINFTNQEIQLECKDHGLISLSVQKFLHDQSKNTYLNAECDKCSAIKNNQKYCEKIFYYCFDCEKILCPSCKQNDQNSHSIFPINEIGKRCPKHKGSEYIKYCSNEKVHLCKECNKEKLKEMRNHEDEHVVINISENKDSNRISKGQNILNELKGNRNGFLKKLQILNDLIILLETTKNSYEKNSKNYILSYNYNLLFSLLERHEKFIRDYFFMQDSNISLYQAKLIEEFNNEFGTNLDHNKDYIDLYRKKLKNEGFSKFVKIELPKVSSIYAGGNELTNLSPFKGIVYNELKHLSIDHNELTDLTGLGDLKAPDLDWLSFHINKISSIKGLTSTDFKNLTHLDLSNNKITNISPLIDCHFPKLKKLNLNSNGIEYIEPINSFKFPELEELKLNDNKINNLNDLFRMQFNNLKQLEIKQNNLYDISAITLFQLRKLETLDLSLNHIKDISYLTQCLFHELKFLFLSNNEIEKFSFPKTIFPELKMLTLKNNHLNFLDRDTKNCHENLINRTKNQQFDYDLVDIKI